jgi:hypothetical protein
MSNRHGGSYWPTRSYNLRVELLRERLNDAGAEPGFGLGKNVLRLAHRKDVGSKHSFTTEKQLQLFHADECLFSQTGTNRPSTREFHKLPRLEPKYSDLCDLQCHLVRGCIQPVNAGHEEMDVFVAKAELMDTSFF